MGTVSLSNVVGDARSEADRAEDRLTLWTPNDYDVAHDVPVATETKIGSAGRDWAVHCMPGWAARTPGLGTGAPGLVIKGYITGVGDMHGWCESYRYFCALIFYKLKEAKSNDLIT